MASAEAAKLVRDARVQAGMTQRALARRARTAQSVVARIELNETSPSWTTLTRILAAAGFRVSPGLVRIPKLDRSELDDIPRILRLTPEERLLEVARVSRFISAARRV
jgi:transcriptional regulator with XRE-family HTH domain